LSAVPIVKVADTQKCVEATRRRREREREREKSYEPSAGLSIKYAATYGRMPPCRMTVFRMTLCRMTQQNDTISNDTI